METEVGSYCADAERKKRNFGQDVGNQKKRKVLQLITLGSQSSEKTGGKGGREETKPVPLNGLAEYERKRPKKRDKGQSYSKGKFPESDDW